MGQKVSPSRLEPTMQGCEEFDGGGGENVSSPIGNVAVDLDRAREVVRSVRIPRQLALSVDTLRATKYVGPTVRVRTHQPPDQRSKPQCSRDERSYSVRAGRAVRTNRSSPHGAAEQGDVHPLEAEIALGGGRFMRTVVVAVDWSPVSERAVGLAGEIARGLSARCILLHVRSGPDRSAGSKTSASGSLQGAAAADARTWLSRTRDAGVKDVQLVVLDGSPVEAILSYLRTSPPDLLVFGRRGGSPGTALLLGGVSSALLQQARCPVLVVT